MYPNFPSHWKYIFKGLVASCHSFFSYFITYMHSINHILTIHLSIIIRWGLSPFLHRLCAQWETPPCPCYSKPTRYQLSHAAPYWKYMNVLGSLCAPRPDWICMWVVPLDTGQALKRTSTSIGFWFFNFSFAYLKILQSSEPLQTKMNPTSCLLESRFV